MSASAAFALGAVLGAGAAAAAARFLHRRWTERRGRLLAFALHELNTPATAASLTLINLADGVFGDLTEPQAKWTATAVDQLSRLGAIAGEARDLVHLELLGGLKLHVEPVSLADLIDGTLSGARGAYAHADIPLEHTLDQGLPEVLTDAERAGRTLSGLLYHARKFRAAGPVRLRARRAGDSVVCEIDYESVATTPAEAEASLDLFYPARARKDHVLPASGLGLGLSRAVMRLAGGDVDCALEGGRARLALILPARP